MHNRCYEQFGKRTIICLIFVLSGLFLLTTPLFAAPTVTITSPSASDNDSLDAGISVLFSSNVLLGDLEDTISEYLWHSTRQGVMSNEASFNTSNLQVGVHTITLQVTDSNGESDSDSVEIEVVNDPPVVTIIAPAADTVFEFGNLITFRGSADDPQEGVLSGNSLIWTSSQGGAIGTGGVVALDTLTSGEHVITLTAADSFAASSFVNVRIWVGNSPPRAEIIAPDDGQHFEFREAITFRGAGEDDEDGVLPASSLLWSLPATEELLGEGTVLAVDDMESGTHTIRLTVIDSDGAAATDEIVVIVGNATPASVIAEPADNSAYKFGAAITFRGTGSDSEDGSLTGDSLVWRSSLSGFLSTGASFSFNTLAVGEHEITLTASDSEGLEGTDSIRVVIGDEPPSSVSIDSPSDNDSFFLNDFIGFEGTASDTEDGDLSDSSLVWTSDLEENPIGTGRSFLTNSLAEGEHLITLTATDSSALSISTSIVIIVGNRPPEAQITIPEEDGISFEYEELITFQGTGSDPDDGRLTGDSLVWTTSQSTDPIGTGETVSVDSLASGEHIVTLTVTDSSGVSSTASRTIVVGNSTPSALITSPENGSFYTNGETINFSGTGVDLEDGMLAGSSLVWTLSGSSDPLGEGTNLTISHLPSGTHTITLTVTDSTGAAAIDTVSIIVGNASPVMYITSPADNSNHPHGFSVAFSVDATDLEDGVLTGTSLVWVSDRDGFINYGTSFNVDDLSVGIHKITVTATDSGSLISSASITITIGDGAPTPEIISPDDNAVFAAGELITFEGKGVDPDDGELTGDALIWRSSRDDIIGKGEKFFIDSLSSGLHLISLTAVDGNGSEQSVSLTITIENTLPAPPTARITDPEDGIMYSNGAAIVFKGTGTDFENNKIPAHLLVWHSSSSSSSSPSSSSPIGTGSTLVINNLPSGSHAITLTVTDSNGATATDTVLVTVTDASPVVLIKSPADNSTHSYGSAVDFSVDASDPEDGDLIDKSLVWESDRDGFISYGTSFSKNNLSTAVHKITVTATDSYGLTAKDFITITIVPFPDSDSSDDEPSSSVSFDEHENHGTEYGDVIDGPYIDNGNGTVTDQGTDLMWQQTDDGNEYTWDEACKYCNDLLLGGHNDWKLPDIFQLEMIINRSYNPSINTNYFKYTQTTAYWSLSTYADYTDDAWYVNFSLGHVRWDSKTYYNYARCVRSEQCTQDGLTAQYEAGKKYCMDNPAACGIFVDAENEGIYNEGYIAGLNACDETNAQNTTNDNCASFDMFSNILKIPCLDMGDIYWVDLKLENDYLIIDKYGVME